jgi:hypothetical protein
MGNLINTILFVFALQFCYAQKIKTKYPSVIILHKDTLVCFTTEQSKQVAVWNEERKQCLELSKNDSQKINELENIITQQKGLISNLEKEKGLLKANLQDKDGLTPLHIATKLGCVDMCTLLLQRNAVATLSDTSGKAFLTFVFFDTVVAH